MKTSREQHTASKPRKGRGPTSGSFKKGDPRINRQGKSKELAELEREFRQAIIDGLTKIDEHDPDKRRTNFQAITEAWIDLAKGRNLSAIESLVERVLGKSVQPVGGVEGQPLEYRIITNVKMPHRIQ
jgi:hypothetical protein